MTRQRVVVAGVALAGLVMAGMALPGRVVRAAEAHAETAPTSSVLVDTMASELQRAMNSLGSSSSAAQQPKPYFLSYSVADGEQVSISAQFGAITNSNQSHRRFADVQVRIGSPAEDNTHGDHRNSALTTIPITTRPAKPTPATTTLCLVIGKKTRFTYKIQLKQSVAEMLPFLLSIIYSSSFSASLRKIISVIT